MKYKMKYQMKQNKDNNMIKLKLFIRINNKFKINKIILLFNKNYNKLRNI